jgi:hypothetical protein
VSTGSLQYVTRGQCHQTNGSAKLKTILLVCSAILLASCGGGGGGTSTTTPAPSSTPSSPFLDSFGVDVSSAGFGEGDAGADGSAGDGAPIVGGTVNLTDVNGKTANATTNSNGYYRIKVTGFTPPFVLYVNEPGGKTRYSLNVKPLKTKGFVTVNLSGLTDKVASDVAIAGGKTGAVQLTPQIVSANSGVIATSVQNLKTQLAGVITSSGLDPTTFDPLSVPFVPNHTGYDYVLDNTVITRSGSGATSVVVSPTYVPQSTPSSVTTLAGNWQQQLHFVSWSLPSALPSDPASTSVAGANVPSSVAFTNNWVASVAPQTSISDGVTYTTTFSTTAANAFRATTIGTGNGTNVTQVLDYIFTNFAGCAACGVGSKVTYTMTLTLNALTGTFNGVNLSPSPATTAVVTNTFTRLN